MTSTGARHRCPFTASQWQELEHQALIFKYMISGVPIPPELVYAIRSSMDSRLFPKQQQLQQQQQQQQPIGWGCFHIGFGRKADSEPGRCRRTDGKKWRCSKEAHPDSKYCEKHMHRGRNRSRKPVEVQVQVPSSTPASTTSISSSPSPSPSASSSMSSINTTFPASAAAAHSYPNPYYNTPLYPFLNLHSASGSSLSTQKSTSDRAFFDSGSCSSLNNRDYRDFQGSVQDPYQSLKQQQEPHQEQAHHCFVWGTDFKSPPRTTKPEGGGDETAKQQLHQFFEEWQPKNTDSWP